MERHAAEEDRHVVGRVQGRAGAFARVAVLAGVLAVATLVAGGPPAVGEEPQSGGPEAAAPVQQAASPAQAAPAPVAAEPAPAAASGYAGSDTCWDCHDEKLRTSFSHTIHAKVFTAKNAQNERMRQGCEGCHGPAEAHVESGGTEPPPFVFKAANPDAIQEENGVCLHCHDRGARIHWSGSPHESRDVACTSCHVLMENRSGRFQLAKPTVDETCTRCHLVKRASLYRDAHMPLREGAMSCTSCHAPHGSVNEALLKGDTVNDTCFECHADKRGPFLWEHVPVTESCLNCHSPHGSTQAFMLTLPPPRLCQQCHVASLHPSEARMPQNRFVIGRACLQCHVNIHGSNHPSGFAFTR